MARVVTSLVEVNKLIDLLEGTPPDGDDTMGKLGTRVALDLREIRVEHKALWRRLWVTEALLAKACRGDIGAEEAKFVEATLRKKGKNGTVVDG